MATMDKTFNREQAHLPVHLLQLRLSWFSYYCLFQFLVCTADIAASSYNQTPTFLLISLYIFSHTFYAQTVSTRIGPEYTKGQHTGLYKAPLSKTVHCYYSHRLTSLTKLTRFMQPSPSSQDRSLGLPLLKPSPKKKKPQRKKLPKSPSG